MTKTRQTQYDRIIGQARTLFLLRNAEYGDSITETGVLGATVELIGVVARLRQVVLLGEGGLSSARRSEILHDKLQDGINYCVIALMMLEEDNLHGQPLPLTVNDLMRVISSITASYYGKGEEAKKEKRE